MNCWKKTNLWVEVYYSLHIQSSWEAKSHSAGQEICLLLKPNVHYRFHTNPPLDPTVN